MQIKREDFLNNLAMVRSGLSPREFIEQSSCFVFEDGCVKTFNDEVFCEKEIELDITGAVQATALLDILQKLDDEFLLVEENDKGELEFSGKKKRFGIMKEAEIFLPTNKVERPKDWRKLPPEFTQAVGLVKQCVSKDDSKFMLTCVHITPTFVEACDNFQIMRSKIKLDIDSEVLVRGTALQDITELAMNRVCVTKSWFHFKNEAGLIYSCRHYAENYPDLQANLKTTGHPIVLPKGMAKSSERAAVFALDKTGEALLRVNLISGAIKLTGEGLCGWYKEVGKVKYDGPPIEFLISPGLMKYICETHSEAIISDQKLAVTGGSWDYVTVLSKAHKSKPKAQEKGDEDETD